MHLNCLDSLTVRFSDPVSALATETAVQMGARNGGEELAARLDVTLEPISLSGVSPDVGVGSSVFRAGDRILLSDGSGKLAELPATSPGGANDRIIVHPEFKPYRFLYFVLFPLLKRALNDRGRTFLHASAVSLEKNAFVFSAWGGTGKTNVLLHFLDRGAEYLGDDLVVVDGDGNVYPFPRSLNLYDYNLAVFTGLRRSLPLRVRGRMFGSGVAAAVGRRLLPRYATSVDVVRKKLANVRVRPEALGAAVAEGPVRAETLVPLWSSHTGRGIGQGFGDRASYCVAAVANLKSEFRLVCDMLDMVAFLTGEAIPPFVGETDSAILSGFMDAVRICPAYIPPGADRSFFAEVFDPLIRDIEQGRAGDGVGNRGARDRRG